MCVCLQREIGSLEFQSDYSQLKQASVPAGENESRIAKVCASTRLHGPCGSGGQSHLQSADIVLTVGS